MGVVLWFIANPLSFLSVGLAVGTYVTLMWALSIYDADDGYVIISLLGAGIWLILHPASYLWIGGSAAAVFILSQTVRQFK